ncbi:MAG: hypothetical protein LPK19_11450 [Hymenobacteraceae bacterium]|nr:hypothetical protein [Hymenobacteraceae bacterium]MDX5396841.1 hypothetical protein [Hymenobacteraceae bacterium]MDX5512912.1 hypothetical protein [Hymenobacteraceae bacterium]
MIKLTTCCFLVLLLCGSLIPDAAAQSRSTKKAPAKSTASLHGTATVEELAQVLHRALQENNPELLTTYFPTEGELKIMQDKGSADMKALLELLEPEQLYQNFQDEYRQVVEKGVNGMLNWSDMRLTDVMPGTPSAKNPMIVPVEMILADQYTRMCSIKFNAVKLNNRYLLFQHMLLKCMPQEAE